MAGMRYFVFTVFWIAMGLSIPSLAEAIQPVEQGPVHEAYLQPVTGAIILDAIDQAPPQAVIERIPQQQDPNTIWIPGYWAWSGDHNDFLWVSGVWRRPPPNMRWIAGYWQQMEEGWVYVKGFWFPLAEDLAFISQSPPDPLEENVLEAPSDNFFWAPGYWVEDRETNNFVWFDGEWKEMDPDWVFVPAHYIWRPEGYLFIPSYWDWPLEARGMAYETIYIEPERRLQVVYYEPTVVIEPEIVIRRLFIYYPNYLYFYHHYYYYHRDIWVNIGFFPPWWGWTSWWAFSWHNQWGLWWWYTHPGYPQPYWITPAISNLLPPPPVPLLFRAERAVAPSIVTPYGVVEPSFLANELRRIEKRKDRHSAPIIPASKQVKENLFQRLRKDEKKPTEVLKPSGSIDSSKQIQRGGSVKQNVPTPVFNLDKGFGKESVQKENQAKQIKKAQIPSKPNQQQIKASVEQGKQQQQRLQEMLQKQLEGRQLNTQKGEKSSSREIRKGQPQPMQQQFQTPSSRPQIRQIQSEGKNAQFEANPRVQQLQQGKQYPYGGQMNSGRSQPQVKQVQAQGGSQKFSDVQQAQRIRQLQQMQQASQRTQPQWSDYQQRQNQAQYPSYSQAKQGHKVERGGTSMPSQPFQQMQEQRSHPALPNAQAIKGQMIQRQQERRVMGEPGMKKGGDKDD